LAAAREADRASACDWSDIVAYLSRSSF
jgi:hypothetical protein